MSRIRTIYENSVFERTPGGASMSDVLASMFHRSSAVLYGIYVLWASISLLDGVPSLVQSNGHEWQVVFSACVLLSAAPACFGAVFFPQFARLELFSGSSFVGLLVLYLLVLTWSAVFYGGSWSGVIVLGSALVIPTSRCVVVSMFLLRQAEERRTAESIEG